ncbi:DNA-binding CsgD family transcriptional regulator [Sinobacterium caligoides]|uniref:DNA-binding CsgD family transcriptional regulator n=1 Tax=Sinobacterium caligoides TaxID=933926 RepID=A0A3N2DGG4_9GAMM|nr:hypothetical protein [Sinobacterium caligoides]ROR98886.1 DNA-binding CsgD family transcriptional regulator [Sinobacterium caligoides]
MTIDVEMGEQSSLAAAVSDSELSSYNQLVYTLYDSASSDKGFTPFLAACCETLNARTAGLFAIDIATRKGRIGWASGYPEGLLQQLIKSGATEDDESVLRALSLPLGAVYSFSDGDDDYDIYSELSPISQESAKTIDMSDNAGVTFELRLGERFILMFNRSRDQGVFKSEDLNIISLLAGHVEHAVMLYEGIYSQKALNKGLGSALDVVQQPIMLFSASGSLASVSDEMEKLNQQYNLFTVGDSGIVFNDDKLNEDFHRSILVFLLDSKCRQLQRQHIFIPTASEPLRLTFRALLSKEEQFTGLIVEAKDSNAIEYPSRSSIRAIIDATESEAKVVERLIRCDDIKSSAKILQLTENTVRSYIKSVMAKNGFKRQIEMISLIIKSTA